MTSSHSDLHAKPKSASSANSAQYFAAESEPSLFSGAECALPGSMNDAAVVRGVLVDSIRKCGKSREQIADAMSYYAGSEITVRRLNGFTAESAEDYRFPAELDRAFCAATGDFRLLFCRAELAGYKIITKTEAELLDLGREYLRQKRSAEHVALLEKRLAGGGSMSACAAPQLVLSSSAAAPQWLSADEVMRATGWSRPTFFRRCGELISRESERHTRNGRCEREYLASSLPASATPQTRLALVPAKPALLGPLFSNLSAGSATPIMLPNPEDQKQATERLAVIEPLLEFADDPGRFAALRLADGRPVTSLERMIEYAAETHACSAMTVKRWRRRYLSGGFAALADKIRADKGQSRWFAAHSDAAMLAAYLYLDQRQSISFVLDQIKYEAERLGLTPDELPSHETVRVFLSQNISPAMRTLAREGQREYRERMAPYIRRGYTDIYANQVWVGDHAIHDAEVSNDLFDEMPFGTPGRLRISAFVDYRSRKAWGTWAWEGSSRSIAATMLRAMLEVGPPESIYVDNGKDYKKVAKGALHASEVSEDDDLRAPAEWWRDEYQRLERTGLLARLGISVTHCIPRHPQSKHVERFFRTMHMHFDAVHSTYTSGSPFTRPEATEKAMMHHRRLLKAGRVEESDYPLASRFILGCLSWLNEYNNTPQSGEGMDGRTPNEVFEANRNPNQKPTPEPETLALLLAEYVRREVHECAVKLKNYRYTPRPEDRAAWAAMHEQNEREVLVGYNSDDPEFAVVLDLDGRFQAWLEAEPLLRFAPNDPVTQAQIGASMEMRRGMEKTTKASLAVIATAARANGARSAEEMLYSRLQLPAATGAVITQRKSRLAPDKHAVAPKSASEIANSILEELL